MSPIQDIQPRLRQIIRIRMGQKVPAKKQGETRPEALDTWRLTSPHQAVIDRCAELWGGKVEEMADPSSADRWEVTTETSVLPCAIPPIDGFSQWYETWGAGGCQRRCDGVRELIDDTECLCGPDPEERVCKPTTRVTVVLTDIDELAGARLESHGYNAASELAYVEAMFAAARARRTLIPAELRIAPRTGKKNGKTVHFVVPELAVRMGATLEALGMAGVPAQQLQAAADQAALPAPDPTFGPAAAPAEVSPPPASSPKSTRAASENTRSVAEEIIESIFAVGMRDEEGATFIRLVTDGRGVNPKILNDVEVAAVRNLLTQIERRELEINFEADGGPCFVDARSGERLYVHHTSRAVTVDNNPPPPNWKALASAAGLTKVAVLRRARDAAAEMQLDVPNAVEDIVDEDLAAVLVSWLEDQAHERADKAGAPA
jgi:hypothetical protein